MLFTKGKHREYERLMQEKPNFGHREKHVRRADAHNKDCPHCLYYNETLKKCGLEKCIVFRE